jgi:trehalose 6-phosphate phosphatase
MRILNASLDLEQFFARLRRARERLLFVDYDGTLAPFTDRPERARPYPGVAPLLARIGRDAATRVVMVSGRRLADLERPLAQIASHDAWGAHGWQRARPHRPPVEFAPSAAEKRQLDRAEARTREAEAFGARVERKPGSVAAHWRGLDAIAAGAVRAHLQAAWASFERAGLQALEFEGGVELRARSRHKGSAVSQCLAERGGGAVCAFLGDDHTDEDAFAAVRARGIGVLVRPRLRATGADVWLAPPRELLGFLARWHAAATG